MQCQAAHKAGTDWTHTTRVSRFISWWFKSL